LDGVRIVLAEVLIADGPALSIRTEVTKIAVRYVVAIGVGPTTKGIRDRPGNRTRDVAGDIVRAKLRDVAAGSRLQGCFAIAEQVVRDSKSRIEILPDRKSTRLNTS